MQITEVKDERTAKMFIRTNVLLNSHDAGYIRPLDKDIESVFDKRTNKALRHAEITRWILLDNNGSLIGRVAAFVNKRYRNKGDDFAVGGIGFFDCVNSQEAAEKLFDTARDWLSQRGVEAMDGPINCGERDRWWGLLVEGFTPPPYCVNYNQPYYQELFESYGFKPFYNQVCFSMKVKPRFQQKFYDRHAELAKNPDIRAEHIDKNRLEKFAEDFTVVYNNAWAGHGGMKEIKKEVTLKMFRQMKPVMDEKLVWFIYHKQQPVAMFINLPDLNQWFKYLNGRFGPIAKLQFLWIKMTKKCDKITGLVFGVVPQWQGTGLDSYMIVETGKTIQALQYEDCELQWIGDFNPKMINIAANLGTYRSRKLTTYRYLFDRTKEFRRHPIFN